MNKDTLVGMVKEVEERFNFLAKERDDLKSKWDEAVAELNRLQGEHRSLKGLVDKWVEPEKKK